MILDLKNGAGNTTPEIAEIGKSAIRQDHLREIAGEGSTDLENQLGNTRSSALEILNRVGPQRPKWLSN